VSHEEEYIPGLGTQSVVDEGAIAREAKKIQSKVQENVPK